MENGRSGVERIAQTMRQHGNDIIFLWLNSFVEVPILLAYKLQNWDGKVVYVVENILSFKTAIATGMMEKKKGGWNLNLIYIPHI